jgi:hypothetical protein
MGNAHRPVDDPRLTLIMQPATFLSAYHRAVKIMPIPKKMAKNKKDTTLRIFKSLYFWFNQPITGEDMKTVKNPMDSLTARRISVLAARQPGSHVHSSDTSQIGLESHSNKRWEVVSDTLS